MLVAGKWLTQADGGTRPILQGELRTVDGTWYQADFVIDTGADVTVIDEPTADAIGLVPAALGSGIVGVGGVVASLAISTALHLKRSDGGQPLTFNGRFLVAPKSSGLELNLIGRDILDLFTVILDRAGDQIWLIRPDHRYVIV